MATQHCEDTKSYWIVYFKAVSFISMKNFLFKKRERPGSTYLAWMFTLAEMCVSLFPAQHRVQTPHKIPKSWGAGSSLAPTLGTSPHWWQYQEVSLAFWPQVPLHLTFSSFLALIHSCLVPLIIAKSLNLDSRKNQCPLLWTRASVMFNAFRWCQHVTSTQAPCGQGCIQFISVAQHLPPHNLLVNVCSINQGIQVYWVNESPHKPVWSFICWLQQINGRQTIPFTELGKEKSVLKKVYKITF